MKSIKKKVGLFIAHHMFLTKDERYNILAENDTIVIGASLPVWLDKAKALEPSTEIFCKYKLVNNKDTRKEIEYSKKFGGYTIYLPQLPEDYQKPDRPTDEEWRAMTILEQEIWYEDNKTPKSVANLRDIADGGAEYLRFSEKLEIKKKSGVLLVAHEVVMRTMDSLETSLL